jgi:isoleucyl-tRNA synthetase
VVDRAAQLQARIEVAFEEYRFLDVYQQVHGFCARELGGFYLDVIKDRQYTTQADSVARRSAQTALYHVVEALSRWVAPILSFTAEEIYENIPGKRGDSVLLEEYYTGLDTLADDAAMGRDFWERVLEVKQAVNKCLEDARNAKAIKGSLAAEVTLYVDDELRQTLARLGDEQRFVMLTSEVRLAPLAEASAAAEATELAGLKVAVAESANAKCERCWHHREDVGAHAEHPDLCGRCISNLPDGAGETRQFA